VDVLKIKYVTMYGIPVDRWLRVICYYNLNSVDSTLTCLRGKYHNFPNLQDIILKQNTSVTLSQIFIYKYFTVASAWHPLAISVKTWN